MGFHSPDGALFNAHRAPERWRIRTGIALALGGLALCLGTHLFYSVTSTLMAGEDALMLSLAVLFAVPIATVGVLAIATRISAVAIAFSSALCGAMSVISLRALHTDDSSTTGFAVFYIPVEFFVILLALALDAAVRTLRHPPSGQTRPRP